MDERSVTSTTGSTGSTGASRPRSKMSNACEACRSAKVKCQPSTQTGICQRCLEFKRECVFRTGPRTRRPRQSRLQGAHHGPRPPPPPGPSKTFSINFDMPAPADPSHEAFESLASRHEKYIEHLFPPDDGPHTPMFDDLMLGAINSFHHPMGIALAPPLSHPRSHPHSDPHSHSLFHPHPHTSSPSSHLTPPHSHRGGVGSSSSSETSPPSHSHSHLHPHHHSHPVTSISQLGLKPQFNLDSATKLLDTFRGMLTHFPCIVLPEDATVPSLAKSRPFVLLAILSVASGAESLQGHTLYDEEFRKILGLKFVAGGERSVELLQGLLIYTAWYPFHLRPKNKQAFQYVRMAAEIAHDLELVHPPHDGASITAESPATTEQIEGMRTYLSCYYLVSSFLVTWSQFSALGVEYTQWTATCCDVLERRSAFESDFTLSWLVRCSHIIEETSKVDRSRLGHSGEDDDGQDAQHARFLLLGLEAQFREWRSRVPASLLANLPGIAIATTFTDVYLHASPLLRMKNVFKQRAKSSAPGSTSPSSETPSSSSRPVLRPDPYRLARCLPLLRSLLDAIGDLPARAFTPLCSIDWGKLVQVTILALRLSMPLPSCPGWDDARAREELQFGTFLRRFSEGGTPGDGQENRTRSQGTAPAGNTGKGMNVLTASRIVFGVVRRKYEARLAKIAAITPESSAASRLGPLTRSDRGCPMFDGSLDGWFPAWDPDLLAAPAGNSLSWVVGGDDASGAALEGLPGGGDDQSQVVGHDGALVGGLAALERVQPAPYHHDMWTDLALNWTADDEGARDMGALNDELLGGCPAHGQSDLGEMDL